MKICAYCGRENSDEAIYCSGCGTDEFKNTLPSNTPTETPPSKLEFVGLAQEDMQKNLVTLLRCRTLLEADMIVTQLEGACISAFIPDQFLMQAISWNVNTYGFVRIQVSPNDYEAAKEFLLTSKTGSITAMEDQ